MTHPLYRLSLHDLNGEQIGVWGVELDLEDYRADECRLQRRATELHRDLLIRHGKNPRP